MSTAPLLIELLSEELPPKALKRLSEAFGAQLGSALATSGFIARRGGAHELFATPRRLAVRFETVLAKQPEREITRKGPAVQAGLDSAGKPTQALIGFARSCGVEATALERIREGKAEYFAFRSTKPGESLDAHLASLVSDALKKLPIPKVMRWGDGEAQFVRPVHGLIMLHGDRVVPGTVLGIASGNTTRGHRFQGVRTITIPHANEYENKLENEGKVIASFAKRRGVIEQQLNEKARALGAALSDPDELLDEVTALVEHPAVYAGEFEPEFLSVPQECLVLTMRQNQKYFPLHDRHGKLLPRFLIVSNMVLADPANVVYGNQRVVRPRLADARFFFEQDKKVRLEARLAELDRMVYHNKLGSQRQRVERLRLLAAHIAAQLNVDAMIVDRAAMLCKADLATGMVGEFPELQGVMGRYYAVDGCDSIDVGAAIEQHYRPRFAADALPEPGPAAVLATADKLDILVGIYGIGLQPSGDRDPFSLRRHALGLLRILIEQRLPLRLYELLSVARQGFGSEVSLSDSVAYDLVGFILDRAVAYFRELGYSAEEIESVLDLYRSHDLPLDQLLPRLAAIKAFRALPEAASLIEANKRARNILSKEKANDLVKHVADSMLAEPAERDLHAAVRALAPIVQAHVERLDFPSALNALAGLRDPVDRFFTDVRVVVQDEAVKLNRFALLGELNSLLNRVANVSRLPA
jgi:glycyl-tRNA synthetase beta chain